MSKPLILKAVEPFDRAVEVFQKGGILAFPTETFYGLGVDPFNPKAVERLLTLKGRPENKPVALIIKDEGMLSRIALEVGPIAERLIKRFWPGPLTIILRARPEIPPQLIANTGKVGVRISGGAVTQKLLDGINAPITATSANPSGKDPAAEPGQVLSYFNGDIDLLIDGGRVSGRVGSTVVDVTGDTVEFIREGAVSREEILRHC